MTTENPFSPVLSDVRALSSECSGLADVARAHGDNRLRKTVARIDEQLRDIQKRLENLATVHDEHFAIRH
jgi:hypothetical protein